MDLSSTDAALRLTLQSVVEPPPFDQPPFPAGLLSGQAAVITGGSSGMGLAAARALAQAGARIGLVGRTAASVAAASADLREEGWTVVGYVADVRDPEAVRAAFDDIEGGIGSASILVNNAGANYPALAERMSLNQWRSVTRIALDGAFLCATEFARRRGNLGRGGAVVNNSAQYVWSGFPGDAHSAAAKAAVVGMTEVLAEEWRSEGVRVNCVAAGFFPHARSGAATAEAQDRLGRMIPLGRVGRMREYGWASVFLASPLTQGMTGQTLVIDGADRLRRALMHPEFVPPRERDAIWGTAP